jgi:AcrR family transcriptional regulator
VTPAGRRPGPTTTDAAILAAARALFGQRGYRATTLRAVAEAAGVNQALVRHFFGSKQQLFVAALRFPAEPLNEVKAILAEAPRAELGRRLVLVFVRAWRDPETGPQLQAVFRAAATDEEGAGMARRMAEDMIIPTVSKMLRIPPVQAAAALSQLLGFAFVSRIMGAQPLAGLDESSVVALLAPAVQRYLDGSAAIDT